VNQARDERSPFEFVDMSVKQPWEDSWKTRCRSKIKGCDGVIALLSKNTAAASGALWEMKCASEEGIPMIGVHIHKNEKGPIPTELRGYQVIEWNWAGINSFIQTL
jgi:nucleoside 2-deoxyribosyltransferase